ncbi:copper amine oxidase N-terminal domain-containing protein [Paenibacillus rhizovicinus]|uniref:Copper amine oxidase N-terminal domain-containing protein n=1 Tax=Paenibacillus rhizovicinus TaxID=2704463 RepID=A0A6C0NU19_9BACL|nr:copper amine oxidase N-terminal domain-containing protein [Paenibacillus rhizovicinus]QHW29675.1 copper amine oxidase N-terminal domain-containing protein [Paenibacillus rhizovicinus]
MKRLIGLGLTIVLTLSLFAGTASAATATAAVKVKLNGEWVIFPSPPVIVNGKTFVEFRTLFNELGYDINYDNATKKIKASSQLHDIQMTPTGTTALVDGAKVPVNGEMVLMKGRTMVGVRFISTLSDKDVSWDSVKKIVSITDKRPTAAQQAELFAVFTKLGAAEDKGDVDAMVALFHSDSPIKEDASTQIHEQFAKMRTHTEYMELSVESFSSKEAFIYSHERSNKVSGEGFFPGATNEIYYTLRKEANGQWAIYGMIVASSEVVDENSLWAQEVSVADADKEALIKAVQTQLDAVNAKDLNAYQSTLDANDFSFAVDVLSMKSLFDDKDLMLKETLERSAVVEYHEDSAILLASVHYDVNPGSGEEPSTYRSVEQFDLVKKNGKWLIAAFSNQHELFGEELDAA